MRGRGGFSARSEIEESEVADISSSYNSDERSSDSENFDSFGKSAAADQVSHPNSNPSLVRRTQQKQPSKSPHVPDKTSFMVSSSESDKEQTSRGNQKGEGQ